MGAGVGSVVISDQLQVAEVDGDSIHFAEVGIRIDAYHVTADELVFTPPQGSPIQGSFDVNTGVLTLQGQASPERYTAALRHVHYKSLLPATGLNKTIYIVVNDGKANSQTVERRILTGQASVSLDIPTAFTPNGDLSNDTWKIVPLKSEESYSSARIRIYNKQGILVFESVGFDNEWDGRHHGELLPADTYFYTIDLNFNSPEGYLRGPVTILR